VGNPIAATMGQKICELYWQLAGKAGKDRFQLIHRLVLVRHGVISCRWGQLLL